MTDIIRCKDCKYLQKWRTTEQAEKFGQEYECSLDILTCPEPDDYCSKAKRKEDKNNFPWYMTLFTKDLIKEKMKELEQKAKEQGMTIDEYCEYLAELGSKGEY